MVAAAHSRGVSRKEIMKSFISVLIIWFAIFSEIFSQSEYELYLSAQAEANRFRGTVFISIDDEVIFEKGYGLASEEFRIKNEVESKYLIGSITKPFTAYVARKVIEKYKYSLATKIVDFGYVFPNSEIITLGHLIDHKSGLKDYYDLPEWEKWNKLGRENYELVQETARLPFYFPPGEGFRYSNTGYIILGEIIEKITGKSFKEVIEEEIFKVLELGGTGIMDNQIIVKGLSTGYQTTPREIFQSEFIDYSIFIWQYVFNGRGFV